MVIGIIYLIFSSKMSLKDLKLVLVRAQSVAAWKLWVLEEAVLPAEETWTP